MNVCVFLGPTLSTEAAAKILDAIYLPPAAQGDVYLAANDGAEVIGLVDGYFQGAPSVWHKEILWAMSRGIHVFGSASMGALRAAELAAFGMQGVGRIFEAYRDGAIGDDDEVAVVHGPQEMGYLARTVPLVNIRATLVKALELDLITEHDRRVMFDTARSLFYWDRTYSALIGKCEARVDGEILRRFSDWVIEHAVDQKGGDAIEMLERIRELPAEPLHAGFQFQRTSAWQDLIEETGARVRPQVRLRAPESTGRVLDELRLEPLLYRQIAAASPSRDWGARDRDPLTVSLIESGHHERFAARAVDKARLLKAEYGGLPEFADAMLRPSDVLEWYFEDSCGTAIPMDLEDYAKDLGLSTSGELCRLLLRELLYELARDVEQVNGAPE